MIEKQMQGPQHQRQSIFTKWPWWVWVLAAIVLTAALALLGYFIVPGSPSSKCKEYNSDLSSKACADLSLTSCDSAGVNDCCLSKEITLGSDHQRCEDVCSGRAFGKGKTNGWCKTDLHESNWAGHCVCGPKV